jgi:hypothetical protein
VVGIQAMLQYGKFVNRNGRGLYQRCGVGLHVDIMTAL